MKNKSLAVLAIIAILVTSIVGSNLIGLQSVGDRQTVLTCDTLAEGDSGWLTLYGSLALDTTKFVEGTGSIKGVVNSGVWGSFFYVSWWGSGDTYGLDLRGWTEVSFRLYPENLVAPASITFRLANYEYDQEYADWSWTTYDYSLSGLVNEQWNTVTVDLYQPDSPGVSAYGKSYDTPNLHHITSLQWIYYIAYDTSTSHELGIDFVEAIYTDVSPPTPSLSMYITPSTLSASPNEQITFTASVSEGVQPYTYAWYVNNEVQSDIDSNFAYTATQVGTYTIKCVVTDSSTPPMTAEDTSTLYVSSSTPSGATYQLDVIITPDGCGTVIDDIGTDRVGASILDENSQILLTANPISNYIFVNWVLDGTNSSDNPITIVMNTDHHLTACFIHTPGTNGQPTIPSQPSLALPSMPTGYYIVIIAAAVAVTSVIILKRRK